MSQRRDMEAAVEAVLFVATEPVPREKLLSVFDERERAAAAEALENVLRRYQNGDESRGVMLDEAGGGLRLVTRPEVHSYLRKFFEVSGKSKLSMAALETLAIVAYRQPITGPEIQELRGVSSSGVLKTLLERRLIRISGRKEVVGKPFLYATTKEFLLHFGLQTLKDLPPLEEFEESLALDADASGAEAPPTEDREEQVLLEAAALEDADETPAEPSGEAGGEEPDSDPEPGEADAVEPEIDGERA